MTSSHTESEALDDCTLFNALVRLKEVSPDDALAIAGHIGARAKQLTCLRDAVREVVEAFSGPGIVNTTWIEKRLREALTDSQETLQK